MTRRRNTHTVDRVLVTDDGDHRPAGRRYYTSETAALSGQGRWTAQTEDEHLHRYKHRHRDRPIPYRFILYRIEAFFRSRDLETWHDGSNWRSRGPLARLGPDADS